LKKIDTSGDGTLFAFELNIVFMCVNVRMYICVCTYVCYLYIYVHIYVHIYVYVNTYHICGVANEGDF